MPAIGRRVGAIAAHSREGVPDSIIGFKGKTYLAEFKTGEKAEFTPDQLAWNLDWKGAPVLRFNGVSDALEWAKGAA